MAEEIKNEDIWFVEFPTYRYVEDVKAEARKKSFRIVDARFKGDTPQVKGAPSLTLKDEFKPKEPAKEPAK